MATKKPKDRKPKNSAAAQKGAVVRFQDVAGADLLIPPSQVTAAQNARLMAVIQAGSLDQEAYLDLEQVAEMVEYVQEHMASDPERLQVFFTGPGALQRAVDLCTAYAAELGKGKS